MSAVAAPSLATDPASDGDDEPPADSACVPSGPALLTDESSPDTAGVAAGVGSCVEDDVSARSSVEDTPRSIGPAAGYV